MDMTELERQPLPYLFFKKFSTATEKLLAFKCQIPNQIQSITTAIRSCSALRFVFICKEIVTEFKAAADLSAGLSSFSGPRTKIRLFPKI